LPNDEITVRSDVIYDFVRSSSGSDM